MTAYSSVDASEEPQQPADYVVGLDGCAGGWFAVWTTGDASLESDCYVDLPAVFVEHAAADRLLVDIPIGLADDGSRRCDDVVRRRLGVRGRSVFPTPCRAVAEYRERVGDEARYDRANDLQRERLGVGLSKQAWNITDKIAEMDRVLRSQPPPTAVYESHPEYCFARLNNGYPIAQPKSSASGRAARFGVLDRAFADVDSAFADGDQPTDAFDWQRCYTGALAAHYRKTVARDDVVDALALVAAGINPLSSVPPEPPRDRRGLPMRIVGPAADPSWDEFRSLAER